MRLLFSLIAHLLVTFARLARPGGLGAVAAESLLVKHQLLIMKRARRVPNLTSWDRLALGVCTLLVSPKRLSKIAVILKPSTLLCLHRALVKRKYRLLYSPRKRRCPGPKGPSKALIAAVIEMKRRNLRFGCRKIAEQISSAFGLAINKDVVRRILIQHYRPLPGGDGPSWLTVIGHAKDSLWSVDLFRCESILLKSFWVMLVMDVFSRRIIGFGVAAANLDGPAVCRMFNRAIAKQTLPRYLSSDHDPLFRFHRWLANLRVLDVGEIKTIACTPRSHAFVERLIGTVRRECLDQTFFWTRSDLERKLEDYKAYYNQHRCHNRADRRYAGLSQRRITSPNRKPAVISLAATRQRLVSDSHCRMNCNSPHTGTSRPDSVVETISFSFRRIELLNRQNRRPQVFKQAGAS
jgi:transposase InsO family protein